MYVIKPTNLYTLARDAIRDSVAITYNARARGLHTKPPSSAWIKIKATSKGRFNFWQEATKEIFLFLNKVSNSHGFNNIV